MGINIDVQGALFPNLLTMVVQLLSTLLIFLAVKKWLWKPVKRILDRRADKMQESLLSAETKNQEASKNLEDAKKELLEAKKSSQEIITNAKTEADNLKNEMLKDAKRQAQNKLDEADKRIESAKKDMQTELHNEIVSVAMSAVEKLLGEKASSEDDKKAIDDFVKGAKK